MPQFGMMQNIINDLSPSRADIDQALFAALATGDSWWTLHLTRMEGFDPNARSDSDGLPAIFRPLNPTFSSSARNLVTVSGIDLNVKGRFGESPIAAVVRRRDVLAAVLERTRDGINHVDVWGNSPFMHAINIGGLDGLPWLIEGTDHTLRNHRGETAWDIAVRSLGMNDVPPPEDGETYLKTIADWAHDLNGERGRFTRFLRR
jgi:hypothetical protein